MWGARNILAAVHLLCPRVILLQWPSLLAAAPVRSISRRRSEGGSTKHLICLPDWRCFVIFLSPSYRIKVCCLLFASWQRNSSLLRLHMLIPSFPSSSSVSTVESVSAFFHSTVQYRWFIQFRLHLIYFILCWLYFQLFPNVFALNMI